MQKEEKVMYGVLTAYRERGLYLRRLEQYEKAKAAFDEAYRFVPDDMRLLIGRSVTCADAVQSQQAYADAELALELEPRDIVARNTQARALYAMSEFERSLVTNYRGSWRRVQPPCFTDGISQGLETLRDCVGKNAGFVMLDFLPLIRKHEAMRVDDNEPQRRRHESRIPHPEAINRLTQEEARKHMVLARVLASKYLGPMLDDKLFIEEILQDRSIKSANTLGSVELKNTIKEAHQKLSERQEILRSQRPYYTVKLAEKTVSHYQNRFVRAVLCAERQIARETAERMLLDIETCLQTQRIMDLIAKASRMQKFLDSKTPRNLPGKEFFIDRLYRAVGEGYLTQHRLSYKLSERGNRHRIAFLMGLPSERPSSYDSVIANFPHQFVDIATVTAKVLENLEMCENSTMKCWLMYELARLYCTQKNYALGKFYGKRCQREALILSNATWWLNGCLVLMSGDMQQGNANEVKVMVEEAYTWTKKLQTGPAPAILEAFLSKCADMASEPTIPDQGRAVLHRQKQILSVMCDSEIRGETEQLFKRISIVPPGRRMSVVPTKPEYRMKSERRRHDQHGLTVIPGKPKDLPVPPTSGVLGLTLFDY